MLTDHDISSIRSRFHVFQNKIYLNSCSQGALSDVVAAGLEEYVRSWDEWGSPWDLWVEQYEAARMAFAHLIGAKPEEIAIVTSASAGINAVASALCFDHRCNVVMGELEFPTMGYVWLAQRTRGAQINFVESTDNAIDVSQYERTVDHKTAIVPVTHVSFRNGFRSDVKAITEIAHAQGALVMLDDYQDCGTRPIDVKALGVDFYVSGTLKYLLAAPGLAFLYVRDELVEELAPTISGWFAQRNPFTFDIRLFDLAPTARRFENGTPPIPSIYASLRSLQLLAEIGLENVAEHIRKLSRTLMKGAASMGIKLKTPTTSVGPLVVLQSRDANEVVGRLAEQNIVASCRHDGVRISFHVYNTTDDVRAVLQAMEEQRELMVADNLA